MPAYDYRCSECLRTFEITRPVGVTGDVACPECGRPAKRLFSPVGVVFKGSGFHNTDYRPRPTEKEPSSDEKSSCSNAGSSGACSSCPAAE